MSTETLSPGKILRMVMLRLIPGILIVAGILFLPAGTLHYWQAWVYLAILFIPILLVFIYFLKVDPSFLERRMRMREREAAQQKIIAASFIFLMAGFVIPGLDRRFGWSFVPTWLVILADLVVLLSYAWIFVVFRENRYASRVVEIEETQRVISSGPYAVVRHPMYVGTIMMYLASPLALASWWALLPILPMIGIIIARIRDEERLLARDLPGYVEYMQKVRYRLIPGIW
jgi:protein-S-isoprenylcysteine O-methyltransferase Ste14